MSDARVFASPSSAQSFFSSRSILPISTGIPGANVSACILESPPGATVAREKFVGFFRSPRTGGIHEQTWLIFFGLPRFLDRIDERPRFFHFIPACEEGRVTAHRVEQQPLVRFRTRFAEGRSVMEIHLHRLDPETGSRHFRLHSQRDSF